MSQASGSFRSALPWVLLLTFMFFVNYTNRAILGPLLVYIEADLGLTHSQATGLLLYLSIGFTVSLALSGFATARVAPIYLVTISVIGSGLFLIALSQAQSPAMMVALVIGLGAVAGLYMTSAMATMGTLIEPQLWTKALAVHELAPPTGMMLAPLIAEAGIALGGDWRSAALLMGGAAIVSALFFLFIEHGGRQKTNPPSWDGFKEAVSNPLLWFFAWCFAMGVSGEFAPYNILPLHLTFERGLTPDEANKLLALSRILTPLAVIAGGVLAPKIGVKRTLQAFFVIQGLTLIGIGLPWFGPALACMFAQPLVAPFAFPSIFTIVTRHFDLKQQPMLFGIAVPLGSCFGLGISPKLLGISGDYLTFAAGFIIFGCVNFLGLPFCRLLDRKPTLD